jgi:hypothetical protein
LYAWWDTVSAEREPTIATPSRTGFEELDFRTGDGLQVSLLWERSSNRLLVAVLDRKQGRYFEIPVRQGQRALDVFRHPFAYHRPPCAARPDALSAADLA